MESKERSPLPVARRCPVCGFPLEPPIIECSRCATPHHADCWDYAEGCAIFGCRANAAGLNEPQAEELLGAAERWFFVFRLQWALFGAATLGLVLHEFGLLVYVVGAIFSSVWVRFVTNLLHAVLVYGAGTVAFLGFSGYLALVAPAWLLRRRVEIVARTSLVPRGSPVDGELRRRLCLPRAEAFFFDAVRFLLAIPLLAVFSLLLLNWLAPPVWIPVDLQALWTIVAVALLAPLGYCWACRFRQPFLASMRNRLQASLKRDEGTPVA